MRNIIIYTVLVLLPFNVLFGQINFFKQYSDNGYDYGQGIVQLEDSSYVVCGSSSSFTSGPSQAFLLHVDSVGKYIWSNDYGGFESESARRVLYKENFGFFIAGYTSSFGNGAYDFYLAKIRLDGQLEWEKSYGDYGWERVNDAALTRDSGVIMVGETDSNPTNNKDIYIVRTDINGDTLWTKTLGGVGDDYANCIATYQDSLFVIGANIYVEDSLKTKVLFLYIKEDGTVISQDTLVSNGKFIINDMIITNDTLQGVGDHTLNDPGNSYDVNYTVVMQPGGINVLGYSGAPQQWDFHGDLLTSYGDDSKRYKAYSMIATWTYPGGRDLHVGKYKRDLSWIGQVVQVSFDNPDVGGELISTSDGGAVMTGYTSSGGAGGANVFILKIGPNENYPTVVGVTAFDNLVDIEEVSAIDQFKVYPNPASQSFTIEIPNEDEFSVKVFNTLGQEFQSETVIGTKTIDVSAFATGLYTVTIVSNNKVIATHRLLIQ
ncbi:MAG: T9SS type A sorting domain-containing protein [Crocinitomicaceae bacterium]|nr:T9SS type A sorting domain-containing protein [Crocinitomicaceae bacterium]